MNMKALFAALLLAACVNVGHAQVIIGGGGSGGGGGTGCIPAGSLGNALVDSGGGACNTDANASLSAGALTLGASGTAGSVTMGNATTGTLKMQPATGALGSAVVSALAGTYNLVGDTTTQTLTNKTLTSPTMTAPVLGTITSGDLTAGTGYAVANLAGLGTSVATFLANPTSANFAAAVTGETGTGVVVLKVSPSLTTPNLNVATATSINGLTLTSSTGTFTLTDLKTLAVTNSLTFSGTDSSTLNIGAGGTLASAAFVATGTSGATIPLLNGTNVWSGQQSVAVTTLTISTATFTPTGATNNYKITLTSACTCTIANPSATPVAGTSGVFEIIQYSGGAKTLTWGSQYYAAGGSSTVQPDTAANGLNLINYYVSDATHIYINIGAANATH